VKNKKLNRIIYAVMITGLIMVVTGVGLATFTKLASGGSLMLLALMIAIGMLLLAPSKIYLTLHMMHKHDEELRKKNKSKDEKKSKT